MILALQSSTSVSNDWWASLKHGGLLIAPSKLNEFFVAESLPALPRWIEDRLRRDVTRLQNGEDEHLSTLLNTVLEDVLGLTGDWQKGSQVDRLWSYPAITREIIRPRRVWQSPQGDVLPIFVADGQDGSKVARLGIGRGKRSVTRVVEWLRKANQKVALLTNGYQWRLIHAGADYDAWCEWDITFWFEVGKLVTAPRSKKPEALATYEKAVNQAAAKLIARVVLPGEWFLVRWGGTRKGSETFYTDPRLALPTTRLMLQPLLYLTVEEVNQANAEANGETVSGSDAKAITQIPRLPEDILKLKVCDPAMESGSFLLAALRYLADALYESLHYYDRIPFNGTQVLCRLPDGKETNLMSDRTLPVPPDHPEFESRLKAALKRFLVEWCIYGVDIDPLAVEFARLSLWVETMDRTLSFSFLDHKLKCGNSLVGCWFEQFQDYPVMAWERDGGDKDHDRFVHHFREFVFAKGKKQGQTQKSGDVWNQAIKDMKASVIRSELKEVVSGQLNLFADWSETPKQTHAAALKTYQETHLAVFNPQEQELTYRQKLEDREEYQKLRQVFDTWCAVWFWSPEYLEIAPTPRQFDRLSPETARIVGQLTEQHQFFH